MDIHPREGSSETALIRVLIVCTGNICRSPLAHLTMQERLSDLEVDFQSAGTRARPGLSMTTEASNLAAEWGVNPAATSTHQSAQLTPHAIETASLIVTMTRQQRREVVEMTPSSIGRAFTVRELARLAGATSDQELLRTLEHSGSDSSRDLAVMLKVLAGKRGLIVTSGDPGQDDVVDPYRRSLSTYKRSAAEMSPGLLALERLLRAILS
ncbi:low molecular weight phosphatase family protein [Microbacterium testaceum]|uniref:arsenate reductase/protein-tyrosine-phosphatase family protein n=1 Tax=Microbacterium testaceum TaxID=2033 RepID=UPI0038285C52